MTELSDWNHSAVGLIGIIEKRSLTWGKTFILAAGKGKHLTGQMQCRNYLAPCLWPFVLIHDVDINKYSVWHTACVCIYIITAILTSNSFSFAFCEAQLNKVWNFPTCLLSEVPPPNHSMTITIHQGSDVGGPIAGLLNRSASKLLFNVSHNSPKQSGLLSISRARPFKWVWYMTHKGLQVSTPRGKKEETAVVIWGRWAWIKCKGCLMLNWLYVG